MLCTIVLLYSKSRIIHRPNSFCNHAVLSQFKKDQTFFPNKLVTESL